MIMMRYPQIVQDAVKARLERRAKFHVTGAIEKYQMLPELPPEQFAALKQDIAERGVQVAIVVDEYGAILDGHNRAKACRELGINDYPVEVRSGLTEVEKRIFARKLNVLRRHLTREQVRQLIADQLRDTADWADRRIGHELGVDHKTVGAVRGDLGSTGEIPQLEKTIGDDGKARPARQSRKRRSEKWEDDWDKDGPWNDPTKKAIARHVTDLIELGVDPNSERVGKLLREAAVCVIEGSLGYRVFAHCTEAGEREWHLFILFLTQVWNWRPEHAAAHVEAEQWRCRWHENLPHASYSNGMGSWTEQSTAGLRPGSCPSRCGSTGFDIGTKRTSNSLSVTAWPRGSSRKRPS